jgi:hypothetical protein
MNIQRATYGGALLGVWSLKQAKAVGTAQNGTCLWHPVHIIIHPYFHRGGQNYNLQEYFLFLGTCNCKT